MTGVAGVRGWEPGKVQIPKQFGVFKWDQRIGTNYDDATQQTCVAKTQQSRLMKAPFHGLFVRENTFCGAFNRWIYCGQHIHQPHTTKETCSELWLGMLHLKGSNIGFGQVLVKWLGGWNHQSQRLGPPESLTTSWGTKGGQVCGGASSPATGRWSQAAGVVRMTRHAEVSCGIS